MNRPTRSDIAGAAYLDLQNRARREGRPTQELLVLYALERFLARLSASAHRDAFVLKGGMLLAAYDVRRATVDVDLLAHGLPNDADVVLARIADVATTPLSTDDGVRFLVDTARARTIRDADLYSGVRVTMNATIATATVKLQLDVNFGDPVTPAPQAVDYPALRDDQDAIRLLGYPLAAVLAEKLTTAVDLGDTNTRVRDYADIWSLTRRHDIDGTDLTAALQATATHRRVDLRPLTAAVGDLATLRRQTYTAYRRRVGSSTPELPADLADLIADVIALADPALTGAADGQRWSSVARCWRAAHD